MKPEEIIRALILLETKTIDLASLFAHEFWPDHKAWQSANQRDRQNVYQHAFTVLSHLMYKRLILPTRPYQLTDAGRAALLVHREQKMLLTIPLYDYDHLSDWHDSPVIYSKILNFGPFETLALYILAERDQDVESYFIASLDHVQGGALLDQKIDMHTAIKESTRRYLLRYQQNQRELHKTIAPITGDIAAYMPLPGEFFKGNPNE